MVRTAYTLHAEDDDWGQAGTMVREVLDDAARERLVDNIVGHLLNGVSEPILQRAFEYWRNVDKDLGDRIEAGVRGQAGRAGPEGRRAGQPGPRRACRPRPEPVARPDRGRPSSTSDGGRFAAPAGAPRRRDTGGIPGGGGRASPSETSDHSDATATVRSR